jgi:undecaprenyl diphosphate synthase
MTQSALHVGVVMDGNGRWAAERGRPRWAGHRMGARAVRRIVAAAPSQGIGTLTLYAFSADNWSRPPEEVAALMGLFERYLRGATVRSIEEGVRVRVIGRRDRLGPELLRSIATAEAATSHCRTLELNLAVDYSARWSIRAGERLRDVDLLIRTGGEQRLSDFLLWECAYAELYFTTRRWPDFTAADLAAALSEFHTRDRRFGGASRTSGAGRRDDRCAVSGAGPRADRHAAPGLQVRA